MSDFDYDLFVIGGGSGGVRASRIAAGLGARVGLAEERYLGGTCVNVGCIPKKLFSYAAHFAQDFEDARGYGWELPSTPRFHWPTLRDNKDREIQRLNGVYLSMLEKAGVKVWQRRATLLDGHTIALGDELITAREVLIATGGWPAIPDIVGKQHVLTSNDLFALETLPSSIVIVGGGYIAVEFAGILAGLNVKTTLVHRGPSLLRGFDTELAEAFAVELQKYATLKLDTEVTRIERQADGGNIHLGNRAGATTRGRGTRLVCNGARRCEDSQRRLRGARQRALRMLAGCLAWRGRRAGNKMPTAHKSRSLFARRHPAKRLRASSAFQHLRHGREMVAIRLLSSRLSRVRFAR